MCITNLVPFAFKHVQSLTLLCKAKCRYKATHASVQPLQNILSYFLTFITRNLYKFQIEIVFSICWDANWNVIRVVTHFCLMKIFTCILDFLWILSFAKAAIQRAKRIWTRKSWISESITYRTNTHMFSVINISREEEQTSHKYVQ